MDVSVVLCTWNNCGRLVVTLDALCRCIIPTNLKWELVLVNNNCTDETLRVAHAFAERLPLRYVDEPRQALSRAKNAGLKTASGRLVVFTDDDVRFSPEWLVTYWSAFQERPFDLYFGGPIACEYEDTRPDGELLRVAPLSITGIDWGPEAGALSKGQRLLGANWACPADALRRSGGFDVRLGLDASLGRRRVGEDFQLMDRLNELGMSAWYLPGARVVHFVPRAKCGMEYIGGNAEAHGVYSWYAATISVPPFLRHRSNLRSWCERRDRMMQQIPWRFYVETALLGLQWCLARSRQREGNEEYLAMRFCIGVIKGCRWRMREELELSVGSTAPRR